MVVVFVSGLAGQPVAEAGQLPYRFFYLDGRRSSRPSQASRRKPSSLRGSEYVPDFVLPDFPAADRCAVVAVGGVGLGFEFLYAFQ